MTTYPVGTPNDVAWIREPTSRAGLSIGAAIPPVFAAYATVVVPDDDRRRLVHDQSIVNALRRESDVPSWWLGYLEAGVDALPVDDAPRVRLYAGWHYVLLRASADRVLELRSRGSSRRLPDLLFPSDRSWLVSTLWDDDWRCIGGSEALIGRLVSDPDLATRAVTYDEDATPPGHAAW
jgi:hypothetical protein